MKYLSTISLCAVLGLGCGASQITPTPQEGAEKAPSRVQVSGFACENGYGSDLNQAYIYQGTTRDGRPYYRGAERNDRYLYFDLRCSDDTPDAAWLLGGKPDLERESGLNPMAKGCDNDFRISSESRELPTGTQNTRWLWCGDHGRGDGTVTLSTE